LFIDIHTHKRISSEYFSVLNLYKNFEFSEGKQRFSAGLHPWYLDASTLAEQTDSLRQFVSDPRVLFVGECGLDKLSDTDFGLQLRAFGLQVDLANELHKPLIIHCVRAHNEVLKLLKDKNNKVPVVFHGYNKNREIADTILRQGHYLSFGADLVKEHVAAVFQSIPVDRIFLESDDHEMSIPDLYCRAAGLSNISIQQLEEQITTNLCTILGPEFKVL
jgi:TatD DNase family protein